MTATVFDSMAFVIFTRSPFAIAATYLPFGGSSRPVRVIPASPKQSDWSAYQSHASITPYVYDVRATEVANPREGDQLTVGTDTFVVRSAEIDEEHLIWRLNVDKL